MSDIIVHFLRHAESKFDSGLDIKTPDVDITTKGEGSVKLLNGTYDAVIRSSLFRSRRTLESSNIKYDRLIECELCREKKENICDFLLWEALIYESTDEFNERVEIFRCELRGLTEKYKKILIISGKNFGIQLTGKELSNAELADISDKI